MKTRMNYLAIFLIISMLLTGCSSAPKEPEQPEEQTDVNRFLVTVNTEGLGEIAVSETEDEPVFDEQYTFTSYGNNAAEGSTLKIACRPTEDKWQFVKWKKNGETVSRDPQITITVTEAADYVAVFMTNSGYEGEPVSKIEDAKVMGDVLALPSIESGYNETHYVYAFELNDVNYRAIAELPEDVSKALWDLDWEDPEKDKKETELIAPLAITRIDNLDELIPSEEELAKYVGKNGNELKDEGWTVSGYDLEQMMIYMNKGIFQYRVYVDGTIDQNTFDETEDMSNLTVKSVEYNGIVNATDLEAE